MRISTILKMKIHIKQILHESFADYKKCSILICGCTCTWKCGKNLCQNSSLALSPTIEVDVEKIVEEYMKNDLTSAIVFGGLEWMDQFLELLELIEEFRKKTDDDIIVYTGYNKTEIEEKIILLKKHKNIIVKFGRYVPGQQVHFDEVLGVYLSSKNQYGEKL